MVSDGTEFAVGDIERLFEDARRNTKTKHETWKKYYSRRRRDVQIKLNYWVLVATHPLNSATRKVVAKFKPKFEGPYRVLDVKNNNVVIWKAGKRLTINVDQVRIYRHRKCDETEIGTGSSRITVLCAMNRVVLTEYNEDQMSRETRGRHNKEDQFDPKKAEKGTIVLTSRSEQDQATRMPDEEVINNGKTKKGEEHGQRNPCHWRSCLHMFTNNVPPKIEILLVFRYRERSGPLDETRGRSARATTSTDDRYIQLTARRNRTENATQLQRQLLLATGRRVSSQTVRNRLHEGGLYARRPMVCIPLTPRPRAARRRWAAEHRDWEQHDWRQVLFTDESLFSLECDTRRVLVWRNRGTRNNLAFVRDRSQ
ncbi:transposable element Tcb2 transposase [Trichonephila clavipes]|nr:transposable element Tcb2 transposase [Trichonephila clavipes]